MQIAFVGFGEAGSAFVHGWREDPAAEHSTAAIQIYDIETDNPATAGEIGARCQSLGVRSCATLSNALDGADIVFCTVTADQALVAAKAAAPVLTKGTVWLDCNSCAPSTKRAAADVIQANGGRYVDVAVMAPVHPKLNLVPCLMSGPHAHDIKAELTALPMIVRVINGGVGAASSIKMIRSIMVKGLEALTAECVLAAYAAGVEDEVLASLSRSHPGIDWAERSAYNMERMIVHGERRAAEMEEVARTLGDLGLPNDATQGTIAWQRRMAKTGVEPLKTDGLDNAAEALLSVLLSR